jgi:hypothetical protein
VFDGTRPVDEGEILRPGDQEKVPPFLDRYRKALDAAHAARFKAQFAAAIVEGSLSAAQYQQLTGQHFDNDGALYAWLYKLWKEIYGDEPVPGDD